MTHRLHPERDDPVDAILWDDCEDCARRAELSGLDMLNQRRAIDLMLSVERGIDNGSRKYYLTQAEREMCSRLSAAWLVFENLGLLRENVLA